jgi:hypothetical protein
MLEIRVLPRKKFDKEGISGTHTTTDEGKHIIEIPRGASTRTRLHEMGHYVLGHDDERITYRELVDREISAEAFAYESMGKKPTWRIAIPVMSDIIYDHNFSPNEAFNLALDAFRKININLSKYDRASLWSYCLGSEEIRKKTPIGDVLSESKSQRILDLFED